MPIWSGRRERLNAERRGDAGLLEIIGRSREQLDDVVPAEVDREITEATVPRRAGSGRQ
jgi:hypothetical protein